MANDWDSDRGGRHYWIAWLSDIMRECLRVLRPGGHAVVWALPRTSHWTATAIEDAGFEIRDVVTHLFGSGFPKSLNIAKAIDKKLGAKPTVVGSRTLGGNAAVSCKEKGGTYSAATGLGVGRKIEVDVTEPTTPQAKDWNGWGSALKPSYERWILCRKSLASTADARSMSSQAASREIMSDFAAEVANVRTLLARLEKTVTCSLLATGSTFSSIVSLWSNYLDVASKRESTFTIETASKATTILRTLSCFLSEITQESIIQDRISPSGGMSSARRAALLFEELRVMCLRTSSAQENAFSEASTLAAPKPHTQPLGIDDPTGLGASDWILARKPLDGTLAENVLEYATGGLNIDATRIATDWNEPDRPESWKRSGHTANADAEKIAAPPGKGIECHPLGRWPANVVLDEEAAEMLDQQTAGKLHSAGAAKPATRVNERTGMFALAGDGHRFGDSGGASRFFYCPKPSTREREAGCEALPKKSAAEIVDREEGSAGINNPRAGAGRTSPGRANHHTTVKSIELMRWLCRLVTPPNGLILDPFTGSGSTGCAAMIEGFHFLGIELDADYAAIANARIAHWLNKK